jgi:hypothetical protein
VTSSGTTPTPDGAVFLLSRAESYARDAATLRTEGLKDAAVVYETVAAELRQIAEEVGRRG